MSRLYVTLILVYQIVDAGGNTSTESTGTTPNQIGSGSCTSHVDEGIALRRKGKMNEARKEYETAIQIDPNYAEAYVSYACLLIEPEFKDYDGAVAACIRAIEIEPNHPMAHNNLGYFLYAFVKDNKGAREMLKRAVLLQPNFARAFFNLGILSEIEKNFKEAKKFYEQGISAFCDNPDNPYEKSSELHATYEWRLGNLLHDHFGDVEAAAKHYENARKLDPSFEEFFKAQNLQRSKLKDLSPFFSSDELTSEARCSDMTTFHDSHRDSLGYGRRSEKVSTLGRSRLDIRRASHPFHAQYEEFKTFKQIADLDNPHLPRLSETCRPMMHLKVKPHFMSLVQALKSKENFCDTILVEWLKLYVTAFRNDSRNFYVLAGTIGVEAKHLVAILEMSNELRQDILLDLSGRQFEMTSRIKKRIAELSLKLYTLGREEGGPYYEINETIQLDKVQPLVEDEKRPALQPHLIVAYGFYYLFMHHRSDPEYSDVPLLLWRGMRSVSDDDWELYIKDHTFYWPCFLSTSSSEEQAKSFCKDDSGLNKDNISPSSVLFCITNHNGEAHALPIKHFSAFKEEDEVLLHPYHQFKVTMKQCDSSRFPGGRGIVFLYCLGCEFHPKYSVEDD